MASGDCPSLNEYTTESSEMRVPATLVAPVALFDVFAVHGRAPGSIIRPQCAYASRRLLLCRSLPLVSGAVLARAEWRRFTRRNRYFMIWATANALAYATTVM